MKVVLILLLCALPAFAIDTVKLKAQIDSLTAVLQKARGDSLAIVVDAIAQADSTLKADKIKITNGDNGGGDPQWLKVDLSKLSASDYLKVLIGITEAKIEYDKTAQDQVWLMRRDRVEKALPVISSVLKSIP